MFSQVEPMSVETVPISLIGVVSVLFPTFFGTSDIEMASISISFYNFTF